MFAALSGKGRGQARAQRRFISMHKVDPVYLEHQLKRWTRPDAHRFVRPDWRRFVRPEFQADHPFALYERKYSPDQPRVPAGSREGGQWTDEESGGGGSETNSGRNDPRIISDASPDSVKLGDQYAQNRPRGTVSGVYINGQRVEPTSGQAARLAVVEAQARDAIRRVQELDPRWSPKPSAYESVEGLIASYRADAQQAQERISELQRVGIGPGRFAAGSIPAGESERPTAAEHREINRIGSETGCHTCGTKDPGTRSGNYVVDHQPPTRLNYSGLAQRLYPQCQYCSARQGGWVSSIRGRQ